MEVIVDLIERLRGYIEVIASNFVFIISGLCYIASLILIIVSVVADQRGSNIGFNAGKWVINTAVAGTLILAAGEIFGF
ncbi:hypothetical protein [Aquimarina mytili]|uniref:Uncharacterized protein n=1 Tax=Aquimarina mytili TaxID=874423 RepID=A0A937DAJ3_9FLAO|nr:hypothetical protein [Aquimarina mytili]MBL0686065.1 hypothetical protein [Aquimarina mytili]